MAETGGVKWFNKTKGYGFLVVDNAEPKREVYFHAKDLQESGLKEEDAREGNRFSFDIDTTPLRGHKAVNLVKL